MSIRLRSQRGAIGTSWQGIALRGAIEAILGVGRSGGGRRYARAGRVQWLDVTKGAVRGDVLDDDGALYAARIDMPRLRGGDRAAALEVARRHPELAVRLAGGVYPEQVETELAATETSLLPRGPAELTHDCSCLDWPGPCKHVAALAYVLIEAVDEHPVHLLTLRGLSLEEVAGLQEATADDDCARQASTRGSTASTIGGAAPSRPDAEGDGDGGATGEASAEYAEQPAPSTSFNPVIADPTLLTEALGEEAAGRIAAFYRAGYASPDQE